MTVIQCPGCFVANSPHAGECQNCGKGLTPIVNDQAMSVSERAAAGVALGDAYFSNGFEAQPVIVALCCGDCGATYSHGMRFCPSCGKALPVSTPTGIEKKVVRKSMADPEKIWTDDLSVHARTALRNFVYVGVLVLVMGITAAGDAMAVTPYAAHPALDIALINFFIGGIFLGLAMWARSDPARAMLGGSLLYTSLVLLFMKLDALYEHPERVTILLCIRLAIVCLLIRTITAGFKHRRLRSWARSSH